MATPTWKWTLWTSIRVEINLSSLFLLSSSENLLCRMYVYIIAFFGTAPCFSANTIRYDIVYLMCGKKLTCSQLSPPHTTTEKFKKKRTKIRLRSMVSPVEYSLCVLPTFYSNIEPPALRRKAATDKLVEKIVKHDSWPIQPDILSPPLLRLTSRKPLWLDLQPVDIKSRWRHNWKSAQVVNSHLVCDSGPAIYRNWQNLTETDRIWPRIDRIY